MHFQDGEAGVGVEASDELVAVSDVGLIALGTEVETGMTAVMVVHHQYYDGEVGWKFEEVDGYERDEGVDVVGVGETVAVVVGVGMK